MFTVKIKYDINFYYKKLYNIIIIKILWDQESLL